jgi:hypothetical protein
MNTVQILYSVEKVEKTVKFYGFMCTLCIGGFVPVIWIFMTLVPDVSVLSTDYWSTLALFGGRKPVGLGAIVMMIIFCIYATLYVLTTLLPHGSGRALVADSTGVTVRGLLGSKMIAYPALESIYVDFTLHRTIARVPAEKLILSYSKRDGQVRSVQVNCGLIEVELADVETAVSAIEAMRIYYGQSTLR